MVYDITMSARTKYIAGLERLYLVAFGTPAGDATRVFIRQLHWSMMGGVFASGVFFGVAVMAGRILGTAEYGRYSFALAIAQMIALLMTWSFEIAIVRALAFTRGDTPSQTYIISSAIFFLAITVVFINFVSYFLPFPIIKGIVMPFATVLAVKMLFDGMVRGLGLFAYQAAGKAIEACTLLIAFGAMVYLGLFTEYSSYFAALLISTLALLAWYAPRVRSDISLGRISYSAFKVLWTYGSRAIIWLVVSTVLSVAAKFAIRYQLGYEFLGQFAVYQMVSLSALGFLGAIISNVLFPLAVQAGNTDTMWRKMNRISVLIGFPLWVLGAIATNVTISLYGPSYYLSWLFGIAMAAVGVVQFLCGIYWLLIASGNIRGIKYMSFHAGIAGFICLALLVLIIPVYPMPGIFISYGLSDVYMVWAIWRWGKKFLVQA